ncbi:MAG: hypothetical protein UV38_C0001G0178 [candidate division TM6 bacterium GW2011_GWE2_42_60]|nr:MAG: hypothetical protein UV38_C0001G0178 [candidate division TM6 bacterium GW2011_GWE2_42_60]HBY05626.1 hypothetical protein [Candidatus Dependentiae bacterium]
MRGLFFYFLFAVALFAEVLAIGFTGSWHLSFVRVGFIACLVSNELGVVRALFGLVTVLVSSFFQGVSLVSTLLYYGGAALIWQPLDGVVSRTSFAHAFMGTLLMLGAMLIEGALFWTPFSACATILLVPLLVQLRYKV